MSNTPQYDDLPESIKMVYSLNAWLWLSDEQKAGLIQQECDPDFEE